MKWLKKWVGLEQMESNYYRLKGVYEYNVKTQREIIDKVVAFRSQICREYIEVKDELEKLKKELLTERKKND